MLLLFHESEFLQQIFIIYFSTVIFFLIGFNFPTLVHWIDPLRACTLNYFPTVAVEFAEPEVCSLSIPIMNSSR